MISDRPTEHYRDTQPKSRVSRRPHGRPRLLILITLDQVGGVATYIELLLPELVKRFEVTVAAHGDGPLRSAAPRLGANYVPLRYLCRPISPMRDALAMLEIMRLCRRLRPHILHANSAKAGLLGRLGGALAGVDIRIFNAHGWAFATHPGRSSKLYLWGERLMRPLTTATICVSGSERERGLAARACDPGRTVVIPNGIAPAPVGESDRASDVPAIITVGRLHPPKDFATFLTALARLAPGSFRARIVGDGPDRAALDRQVRELGLEGVELLGSRADVADLLAASSIFVLSSTSEAMPMSILEAMAAKLPVVASAVGGVPELVVNGETGLLVPARDPEALAGALEQLLADDHARARMGLAGLRRAEAVFSLDRFRQAHVHLYFEQLTRFGMAEAPYR